MPDSDSEGFPFGYNYNLLNVHIAQIRTRIPIPMAALGIRVRVRICVRQCELAIIYIARDTFRFWSRFLYWAIYNWNLNPCNVKFRHNTIVATGKPFWIQVGIRVRVQQWKQPLSSVLYYWIDKADRLGGHSLASIPQGSSIRSLQHTWQNDVPENTEVSMLNLPFIWVECQIITTRYIYNIVLGDFIKRMLSWIIQTELEWDQEQDTLRFLYNVLSWWPGKVCGTPLAPFPIEFPFPIVVWKRSHNIQ